MTRGGQRPDYVTLDDLIDDNAPPSYRARWIAIGSISGSTREEITVEQQAVPVRVQVSAEGQLQLDRFGGPVHILDENGRCSACDGIGPARNWASEVNERSARDAQLQAERYAAYRRMDAIERELAEESDAEWIEVEHRIRRGKKIPERPVRFSWLHGPEEG